MTIKNIHTGEILSTPCSIKNISVGTRLPASLLAAGWREFVGAWHGPQYSHSTETDNGYELTETAHDYKPEELAQQAADAHAQQAADDAANSARPFPVAKVKLRMALRAANLEHMLNDFLSENTAAAALWYDAVVIDSDSELLTGSGLAEMLAPNTTPGEQQIALREWLRANCRSDLF
jgi:hypothetical protein